MSMFEEKRKAPTLREKLHFDCQSYLGHKYKPKYGSTVSFLHYDSLKYTSSLLQEILLCFEGQNDSAVICKSRKENSPV